MSSEHKTIRWPVRRIELSFSQKTENQSSSLLPGYPVRSAEKLGKNPQDSQLTSIPTKAQIKEMPGGRIGLDSRKRPGSKPILLPPG